jgi:hypothetical protein
VSLSDDSIISSCNLVRFSAVICENSSVAIQPVTPTEISVLVATLKKKKGEDIDNLTAEHLQYGGSTISHVLH